MIFSSWFFGRVCLFVCIFMGKSYNKVNKNLKKFLKKLQQQKIHTQKIFLYFFYFWKKIFFMYSGAPKIAQELFFWSHHLGVGSSYWRKYFAVEKHSYVQLYTSDYTKLNYWKSVDNRINTTTLPRFRKSWTLAPHSWKILC